MHKIVFLALFSCLSLIPTARAGGVSDFDLASVAHLFPQRGLEAKIEFWKKIFAEYDRRQVVLHDRANLAVIYKVVGFDSLPEASAAEARRQRKVVDEAISEIEKALKDLAASGREAARLSAVHLEVTRGLERAAVALTPAFLLAAAGRIREQRGIKERFEQGIIRSGLYLPYIQQVFRERGLPEELAYLPHVESSFDYGAYSRAGAAGIWQFMRGTARGLLAMNSIMDERRDPLRSTQAAATVLSRNRQLLGNWPLAITAYNHGTNGLLRAVAAHGNDYLDVLGNYNGRLFGFASQNFYAEFLAALDVAKNYPKHFRRAKMAEPLQFEELIVKRGRGKEQRAALANVSAETLRAYNPAIFVDIRRNFSSLPAGYALRLPDAEAHRVLAVLSPSEPPRVARPASSGRSTQKSVEKPRQYRVRRGDTLIKIASRFGVSLEELKKNNRSVRSDLIFAGQILFIP